MENQNPVKFKLLSIDAWGECEGGWTWNASYTIEDDIYISPSELTPRKIARMLRKWDYLSAESKGRIRIENIAQGDYCFEIQDKNTGEPLLCLSAIH